MSLKDLRKALIGMPRTTLEWDAALSSQLPDVPQETPDKPPTASLEWDADLSTKLPDVPQELPVKLLVASLEWDADLFLQLAGMPREISTASANISAASLEWDADLFAKLPNVPEGKTCFLLQYFHLKHCFERFEVLTLIGTPKRTNPNDFLCSPTWKQCVLELYLFLR